MITVVVTDSGNTKGYLIEDIYIKKDLLQYLTPITKFKGSKVIGKSVGGNIKVRNRIYKSVLTYLSSSKINEIIRAFTLNGVPLNYVLFYPCKPKDIEFEGMSELWQVIADMNSRAHKCYIGVDCNGKELVYMLSYHDLYKGNVFYINMFEVIDKGNKIGTKVVDVLRSYHKEIKGMSVITAVEFWKKVGATFIDRQHFVI